MDIFRVITLLLISFSLSVADTPADKQFTDHLRYIKKTVPKITPVKLRKWIKYEKDFILLDVRDPNELDSGYIDADEYIKISRGKLEFAAIKNKALPQDRTIVVFCAAGSRGALATQLLRGYGYEKVYNLSGGLDGWIAAGYPIETPLGTFRQVPESELD